MGDQAHVPQHSRPKKKNDDHNPVMSFYISKFVTTRNLYASSVGIVAGTVVGTVGFGGAQIVIPSMTLPWAHVANYTQLSATGMSLTSLSISTVSSGYQFWKEQKVHLTMALAIGFPAMLSARIGTYIAKRISGDALALFFNGFSIILMPTHYYIQYRRDRLKDTTSIDVTLITTNKDLVQHAC